ncbi:Sensor histidine kinase RcsC [subsurface metagenome]
MPSKKDSEDLKDVQSNNVSLNPTVSELLDVVSIGMVILSSEAVVVYANPHARNLFGINKNLIGSMFEDLFLIEPLIDVKKLFKTIVSGGSFQKQQMLRIKLDEDVSIWGIVSLSSLKTFSSEEVVLCQIKNISELKEFEETITRQSHLLLELINSLPNNIFIKDKEGKFLLANVWVSRLMGVENPQELLGKTDFDFHPKKLAHKYYQDEQEVINTGKAKINIIEQVVDSHNNRTWYSTSKLPLKNNHGEIVGIMGIGRDITKWVKEQKTLRKAKYMAERADQLKSAFLANLSHEIRTPLNGILGFSQFLKQSLPQKDKNHKYIDFILSNGKHLLHLISDIIDISKIDSGQLNIYKKNFVLNELMSQLEYSYKEIIKQKDLNNIQLFLETPLNDKKSTIFSDDLRIKQILTNLLNNALKFTQGGTIHFGYRLEGKFIRFFVKDTGIGILPDNIKSIFKRFHQVDSSLTRKYEGTGLGLSISKGLVELLGGTIGVMSEVNKGSEFYFIIPYKKVKLTTKESPVPSEKSLSDKHLIVVHDNNQSYDLLEIILFQNNVEVMRARNQNSFFELILSHPKKIDLILLNIYAQWFDGCASIQKIKSIDVRVPILLIVDAADDTKIEECMAAGANDYIVEPINHDLLIAKIKKLIQ